MAMTSRRGSATVDFALTLPLLVVATAVVVQLGMGLAERQRVVETTYEAARFAASGPGQPTTADVQARAALVLESQGLDSTGLELSLSRAIDHGDRVVTVQVAVPVRVMGGSLTLPARHVQRLTVTDRSS